MHFDEIIVATGSTPITPGINLCSSTCEVRLAKDVLKNPEGIGTDIVIFGGGSVGMEVAEYLHHLGKRVTVIEMLDKICSDLGPLNRADVLERIERTSMTITVKDEGARINRKRDTYIEGRKRGSAEMPGYGCGRHGGEAESLVSFRQRADSYDR